MDDYDLAIDDLTAAIDANGTLDLWIVLITAAFRGVDFWRLLQRAEAGGHLRPGAVQRVRRRIRGGNRTIAALTADAFDQIVLLERNPT